MTAPKNHRHYSVEDWGISPSNTGSDNSTAWAVAVSTWASLGGWVARFSPSVYEFDTSPTISNASDFEVWAHGATLQSTALQQPPLSVSGCTDFAVRGGTFTYSSQGPRDAGSHSIDVASSQRFQIADVVASGSSATGIRVFDCEQFKVVDCTISDSLADGLYMRGSRYGTVSGCTFNSTGDDSITLPSYLDDNGLKCSHISVTNCLIRNSMSRGVMSNGASNISISGLIIDSPTSHGVFIGTENSFGGFDSVADVVVSGVVVNDAGASGFHVDGATTAYPLSNVLFADCISRESVGPAFFISGADNEATDITISNCQAIDSGRFGAEVVNAGNVSIQSLSVSGSEGIAITPNTLSARVVDCRVVEPLGTHGILVQSQEVTLGGNVVRDPAAALTGRQIIASLATGGRSWGNYAPDGTTDISAALTVT